MQWLPQTAPALHEVLHVMQQAAAQHTGPYHPHFLVAAVLDSGPRAPFVVDFLNQLLQLILAQVPGKQCQARRQADRQVTGTQQAGREQQSVIWHF